MNRALGRRFRGRPLSTNANASITSTPQEPYAICYYLMVLFENKSNSLILGEYDEAIRAFLENTDKLKKKERLSNILNTEIKELERQNILKPLEAQENGELYFDDSEILYCYDQDKRIDRSMRHYDTIDEDLINLHRVLYCSEKPVFSNLVKATIFGKKDNFSLEQKITFTKTQEAAIFDISKTQFLVDDVQLSEKEALYLLLQCRFNTNDNLRSLNRSYDNEIRSCMPDLLGMSQRDLSYMLRSDQKLKTFGFLDPNGDYDFCMNECIENQSIEPYFSDLLKPLDCTKAYDLNTFSVKPESLEICGDLLKGKNPVSILFYGKPGSGKTELAKAVCKDTGKKVFIFKNEAETNDRTSVLGRLVCLLSMDARCSSEAVSGNL